MHSLHIDPSIITGVLLAAGGIAIWLGLFTVAMLITRPADVRPGPPGQDLPGDEPPAVVSLLVNRWEITEDAAESTLIDLAARRYLEFRQPANDPMQTTVHVLAQAATGLTPYEQMILTRVQGLAKNGMVPLTALTFRDPARAAGFNQRLTAAVVADARARGLSQRRFPPALITALAVTAGIPASGLVGGVALYLRHTGHLLHNAVELLVGLIVIWSFLAGHALRARGERDTPQGRAVAERWLGLRAYLRGDESFADLPPAAVAVWDRYLSYGDAVGATRVCSAVIDLGMGNRRRVWSSFGGTWHQVKVTYPTFWRRYGQPARTLFLKSIGALVVAVIVFEEIPRLPTDLTHGALTAYVSLALTAIFLLPLLYGGYTLVGTIVDVTTPVTVTGEVLWTQVWRSKGGGENSPPVPWLKHFAVDNGTADRTRAWGLPVELSHVATPGDVVTFTARRWTRRILTLEMREPGRERALRNADPNTGDILGGVLGGTTTNGATAQAFASALHPSDVSLAQLLSPDEVSLAVGQPVVARDRQNASIGPLSLESYVSATGSRLLMASVATGPAAHLAIRARRRYRPLPGIGDEAFTGENWVIGRRGPRVVMLQLHGPARQTNPQNVYWLLATAVSRLPAT